MTYVHNSAIRKKNRRTSTDSTQLGKNNILKPAVISPSGRKYYTQNQVDNYLHGKMAPKK